MPRNLSAALGLAMTATTITLAGSLTPPGPPAPTMKPLDQVEARIPISSLPFAISTAGSYYLTRNLVLTGSGEAITVNAGPTTIDLNGFQLSGAGSGVGIFLVPTADLTVRNGSVTSWAIGILAAGGGRHTLDRVTVQGCQGDGADLWDGNVTDSAFIGNAGIGLAVGGVGLVVRSRAGSNGSYGMRLGPRAVVEDCILDFNGNVGIILGATGQIRRCVVAANGTTGIFALVEAVVADCNVSDNTGNGIDVSGGNARIEGNRIAGNGGFGVNDIGPIPSVVVRNSAHGNVAGNFHPFAGDVMPIDTTGTSTNPWVNFVY